MTETDARGRLLAHAMQYVAEHGLTDLSLRHLAAELGTSHRMLIHHFGSKEGLWVAIVQEVERQQLLAMATLVPDAGVSYEHAMRTWWRHISDPSLWPNERLFFEVYAQALQGRRPAVDLLDGIVDAWVEPAARAAIAMGMPRRDARALARLGVAVTRGLLLDLLATKHRKAVDAAMEQWISLTSRVIAEHAPKPRASRGNTRRVEHVSR